MKKILFVAVMLLASAATFAQNSVGQFTFTPKVGLNIADFQKCVVSLNMVFLTW